MSIPELMLIPIVISSFAFCKTIRVYETFRWAYIPFKEHIRKKVKGLVGT